MKKFDLQERLVDFAVIVIDIAETTPATKAGNYLAGQVLRSGISPALNYGEALGGESRNDFLHKMKLVLKELRETYNCLRIMEKSRLYQNETKVKDAVKENNDLISIFVKSVLTAQNNSGSKTNAV